MTKLDLEKPMLGVVPSVGSNRYQDSDLTLAVMLSIVITSTKIGYNGCFARIVKA